MKAADHGWTARHLQQDGARSAAESAGRLREELAQARIELELHERHRTQHAPPLGDHPGHRSRRGRFPHCPGHGVAVGVWFVAFYLLLAILASAAPDVPGSAVHPFQVIGTASAHRAGG